MILGILQWFRLATLCLVDQLVVIYYHLMVYVAARQQPIFLVDARIAVDEQFSPESVRERAMKFEFKKYHVACAYILRVVTRE
jgi:hypothetical protein